MGKEVLEIPAECENCKQVYDLNIDLVGEDWNKTISEVLTQKYGSSAFICPQCRGIARIIETGEFSLTMMEGKNKDNINLELVSKDGNRRVWKVKQFNRHEITFDMEDNSIDF